MTLRRGSGVPQCNVVTKMPLAKQTTDNFQTRPPPELPMAPSIGNGCYLFLIAVYNSYDFLLVITFNLSYGI